MQCRSRTPALPSVTTPMERYRSRNKSPTHRSRLRCSCGRVVAASVRSIIPTPPSLTPFPASIQRASSMPEMKILKTREQINGVESTIAGEDVDEEDEIESNEKLITRKRSKGRNKSGDNQTGAAPVAWPERPPLPVVENSGSVQAVQDWDYWFPLVESIPGLSLEVKDEKENVERKGFDEIREEKVEEKPKEVPPPPKVADVEVEKVMASTGGGRNVKRGSQERERAKRGWRKGV